MRLYHIALLVPLLTGCYVYTPIATSNSPTGQPVAMTDTQTGQPVAVTNTATGPSVRLTLTDAGTANLAAELGPSVEAVGGRLLNDSGDAYVLSLSESRKRNGIEIDWRGEQVSISKSLVANIQRRQFSRTRTFFVAAGVITGIVVARQTLWGVGGVFGSDRPGGGGGPR